MPFVRSHVLVPKTKSITSARVLGDGLVEEQYHMSYILAVENADQLGFAARFCAAKSYPTRKSAFAGAFIGLKVSLVR